MSITVAITDTGVVIRLAGMDAIWALKRTVHLHWSEISDATVVAALGARRRLRWRLLGTAIPGLVLSGLFSVRGKRGIRQFWATRRGSQYLQLRTSNPRMRCVVLDHPNAEELAATIRNRVTKV